MVTDQAVAILGPKILMLTVKTRWTIEKRPSRIPDALVTITLLWTSVVVEKVSELGLASSAVVVASSVVVENVFGLEMASFAVAVGVVSSVVVEKVFELGLASFAVVVASCVVVDVVAS